MIAFFLYAILKAVIQCDAGEVKSAICFCEITVREMQGINLAPPGVGNLFADKKLFAKYQAALHVSIVAVAHVWPQTQA